MQTHPHTELPERFTQRLHLRFYRPPLPEPGAVSDIDPVGAGVLRNHQQLAHSGAHQTLGFIHHIADGAADQIAAHVGDDAETATVVAAFGNFQIGVVPGSQLDALWRHKIGERVVRGRMRHEFMHSAQHFFIRGRAGHTEYFRV